MNDSLAALVKELEAIKARQKALSEKEALVKADIMEELAAAGIDKEETIYGTVRIQRRQEKDYGGEIREMEIALKERKKLAEDLGDYTVINVKESLVFNPPKDIF